MSLPAYVPSTDGEVIDHAYSETGYTDSSQEIPRSTAKTLLNDAKMKVNGAVAPTLQSDDFYNDTGLVHALLGVLCIKFKAHVENVTVTAWDFGNGRVETRESDGESLQVGEYESMIQDGLAEANIDRQTPALGQTHDYIGGSY